MKNNLQKNYDLIKKKMRKLLKKDLSHENYVYLNKQLEIILETLIEFNNDDFNLDRITNPSLLNIANQGVLLLNVSLTREKNKIHYNLWENFIKKTLIQLQQNHVGIIYVFLGKNSSHFKSLINTKTNFIVECPPLELNFNRSAINQFTNCKLFSSINAILLSQNGKHYTN